MNVRDLQCLIATNAATQQRKYDGLVATYIAKCKEYLNSNRDNFKIYGSSQIGIPISSVKETIITISCHNVYFIYEDKKIEDYKEVLCPFDEISDNINLYNNESESVSFSSLAHALEAAGFKVYVHKESKYLVPFFTTKVV